MSSDPSGLYDASELREDRTKTQDPHKQGLSIPVEAPSSRVQQAADELVASKTRLNTAVKLVCSDIDNLFRMSNEFRRDTRKLEKGVDNLPNLEDWLHDKVSAIDQLKSQLIFLHKVIDEE